MSIKAKIRTDASGDITVHMEGGLNHQNNLPLRKELQEISSKNPSALITLDLLRLDFVGSSGIGFFVETIKIINTGRNRVLISNIKPEFLRVFQLFGLDLVSAFTDECEMEKSEFSTQKFIPRARVL